MTTFWLTNSFRSPEVSSYTSYVGWLWNWIRHFINVAMICLKLTLNTYSHFWCHDHHILVNDAFSYGFNQFQREIIGYMCSFHPQLLCKCVSCWFMWWKNCRWGSMKRAETAVHMCERETTSSKQPSSHKQLYAVLSIHCFYFLMSRRASELEFEGGRKQEVASFWCWPGQFVQVGKDALGDTLYQVVVQAEGVDADQQGDRLPGNVHQVVVAQIQVLQGLQEVLQERQRLYFMFFECFCVDFFGLYC